MKIIETTFERLPRERLEIGFEGENQRATVRIDCASVFAEYPNATPALIVKPLFADAYPVVVDRNGTDVDWLITSEILSFSGDGEIQLVFYKDQVICKSAVSKIRVSRSLTVTGDMPDPVVQWIENANRKLAEVDAQIVELEGMVDTATDAATRAEQSASTASAKAEQAATSAATATAKATEATNAAGTATAKAAEAQTAAQTATEKANAAAESERIATAKAGDATTAATTATAKAEQAIEAAQTATEKAGDASTSATAAHASEINAAESADDALTAEVGANAAKRAAEASATQASISEQNAGTAAQTATQKAAEATQSATDAATFAGTATTKAEEAAESAQAAQDAKTAVEQTAEQLADSLEQIDQNTQDIAELDERKANVDGYYPDMTVGNAEQLNSSKFVENSEPYTLRTSGGSADIGNREYVDAVVGGTLAWNQAVRDSASENETDFAEIVTVTDAVEDAAGVKVKIEPVQDLHGYDHPWPAGGGKNKLKPFSTTTINGITLTLSDGFYTSSGSATATATFEFDPVTLPAGDYKLSGLPEQGMLNTSFRYVLEINGTASFKYAMVNDFTISDESVVVIKLQFFNGYNANNKTFKPMICLSSATDPSVFAPYSNICPITGWNGVKVSRTGKNLLAKPVVYYQSAPDTLDECFHLKAGTYILSVESFTNATSWRYGIRLKDASGNNLNADKYRPYTWMNWNTNSLMWLGGSNGTDKTLPITLVEDCYIRIVVAVGDTSAGTVANNAMLELGSTATDYEFYAGNTYDITLPTEAGTVYGGELTVNADGSGSLVVDRAKKILNGTEPYGTSSYASNENYAHMVLADMSNSKQNQGAIMCDKLSMNGSAPYSNSGVGIWQGGSNVWYICVKKELLESDNSAGMISWIASNRPEAVYYLAQPQTYSLSASEIRTLLGTNNVWSDAGQLALTYTGTDEHLTLESGKKYLTRISGTDSMLLGSGQEITAAKGTDNVFDLTQMFGTAVADYVYGQGAAFFRKWFGKQWYPYNAGELRHVEGLQSHDMVGFNQWDEEVRHGYYNEQTGAFVESSAYCANKNPIPAFPNTVYYGTEGSTYVDTFLCYDSGMNYLGTAIRNADNTRTTRPNTAFINFRTRQAYGGTYKHDICINLAHNNSRNGEYAPYEKHSYLLDSSVVLRGVPKVGANGVYWDGDRYLPDGTVERRYGVVDLGALNWAYVTSGSVPYFYGANVDNIKLITSPSTTIGMITKMYSPIKQTVWNSKDKVICKLINNASILVHDESYSDAATFKAAMSGVMLIYELETPTTETAQPYHSTQWVSDWGTEEFVSTGIVPVGSETRYPANLRDKLQHLPDAASGNGSYLITQTDGQMVLTPFPEPPSTAGNYVLKATVVNGVATYTWEVAT